MTSAYKYISTNFLILIYSASRDADRIHQQTDHQRKFPDRE